MRNISIGLLIVATGAVGWQPVEACGDKLLLVGRSVKFQRAYASVYPGNIVLYARPATSAKAAIRDPQFHKLLRQAGHAVSVIEDAALFEQAMRTVAVDVVIADVNEAPKIDALLGSAPSHPKTLYVAFPSNVAQSKALQQQYACELKPDDRAMKYLDKIEGAMKERKAARKATKS